MQKKIIALAIASALTMPALAFAEATVYGQANMSIDMAKDGNATSTSANQLISNNSRIGVKGSEDLGGGMSAIWQMEGSVAMDTGSTLAFDRDTFLGLSSSMGTVKLGLLDTPYKRSTRKLDVFADSVVADNRGLNGIGMMGDIGSNGGGLDARRQNAIDYTSPNFGGFSVAVASVFGAEAQPQPAAPNDKKGTAMSLAAMYEQGPIYATVAIDSVKLGDNLTGDLAENLSPLGLAVDDKVAATKVGVGYSMDAFTANLVLEMPKVTFATGGDAKSTNMYLGGKFAVSSSDAVKLGYTKRGETKSAGVGAKDDATQIAFGYDHAMSKNTTVYALYTKVTQKETVPTALPDPSALSFGMKHSF